MAVSITLSLMKANFMVQIADMFCGVLCTLFFRINARYKNVPSVENPELSTSLFRPGVGQNIAFYTWPAARNCLLTLYIFSVDILNTLLKVCGKCFLNCCK